MPPPDLFEPVLKNEVTGAWVAVIDRDGVLTSSRQGPDPCAEGASLVDNVRADRRETLLAALRDVIDLALQHRLDIEIEMPAGRRVYDATLSPHEDEALLIGLDVTFRRREEARLQYSERLMRDTEGITHLGTWYWDISEPIAHWSPELYQIYGLDPKTHTPTYQDYLTRVHPDDVERVKKATEAAFNELTPYGHDERIRRSDGTWRDLHTWARPILDDDGKLVALLGVCQDITERKTIERELKKSQERYRAVFDLAGDGLAVLSKDTGKIRSANRSLQNLTGMGENELTDMNMATFLHPDDVVTFEAAMEAVKTGPVHETLRFAKWRTQLTLAPLAEDETIVFVEWNGEDADREGRIRQLEAESEWKTRILQVASHELKNPLTPILLNLHTMKAKGKLDETAEQLAERTTAQVKRLSRMVHGFLDTAQLEQGSMVVNWQEWDLDELVDSVCAELGEEASMHGVTIARKGSAGFVEGDKELIRQVLINLIQNATRFTPRDGTVTVEMGPGSSVAVLDDGPGVENDRIPELFQPFGNLDPKRPESSGLGLYTSKVIMNAHEGEIGVEPGPPGHFWFRWPPRE